MRPAVAAFNRYAGDYDSWFETNRRTYQEQLAAVRSVLPGKGRGLEVGVGSGRFAAGLRIRYGLDPAPALLRMARQRGVETVLGVGEDLPFRAGTFDYVLMMTVICFMADIARSFEEAFRVIRPGGIIISGFMEKDGEVARREPGQEPAGRFLRFAAFRSVEEVMTVLSAVGFSRCTLRENLHGLCVITAQKE